MHEWEREIMSRWGEKERGDREWRKHVRAVVKRENPGLGWRELAHGIFVFHPEWVNSSGEWEGKMVLGLISNRYTVREKLARRKLELASSQKNNKDMRGIGELPRGQIFQFQKEGLSVYESDEGAIETVIRGTVKTISNLIKQGEQARMFMNRCLNLAKILKSRGNLDDVVSSEVEGETMKLLQETGAEKFIAPVKIAVACKLMEVSGENKLVSFQKLTLVHDLILERFKQINGGLRKFYRYKKELLRFRKMARRNYLLASEELELPHGSDLKLLATIAWRRKSNEVMDRVYGWDGGVGEEDDGELVQKINIEPRELESWVNKWEKAERAMLSIEVPVYFRIARDLAPYMQKVRSKTELILEVSSKRGGVMTIGEKLTVGECVWVMGVCKEWVDWAISEYTDREERA